MALAGTGDALGAAIMAAVDAACAGGNADRPAIWRAIGNAIITHMIDNGTDSILVVGVQPGGGTVPGAIT